jgi:ABC-2 type transport system permease protein
MLFFLLRLHLLSLKNSCRTSLQNQPVGAMAVIVAGLATFGFTCVFFLWALVAAQKLGILQESLFQLYYYLFLLLLAGSVPFVASTLLLAEDYTLLFSTPLPSWAILTARLMEATIVNSLQFSALGVPAVLASGLALSLSPIAWLMLVPLTFLFLLLPALLVALGLIVLLRIAGLSRMRAVINFLNVLMGALICLDIAVAVPHSPLFALLANAHSLPYPVVSHTVPITARLAPSSWFAAVLLALGGQQPLSSALSPALALLVSNGLLFGTVLFIGRHTISAETLANERSRTVRTSNTNGQTLLRRLLPEPIGGLVERDLHLILRDSVLLSQLAVPAILFAVPFVLALPNHSADTLGLLFYLAAMLLGIILYTQTSILSLSLLGMEGQGYWLVLTAPITIRSNLFAKWLTCTGISGGFGLLLGTLDGICFHGRFLEVMLLLGIAAIISAGLCGIGVGFSAIFPRFLHDNPAVRVSPWALILGFVAATLYVLSAGAALALAALAAADYLPAKTLLIPTGICLFLLISLLAVILPIEIGSRRLEAYEWPY